MCTCEENKFNEIENYLHMYVCRQYMYVCRQYIYVCRQWHSCQKASEPFFLLFFLVTALFTGMTRYLPALGKGLRLLSHVAVFLSRTICFFITDQTPCPYPTRSLPAQFWLPCSQWSIVWAINHYRSLARLGTEPGSPKWDTGTLSSSYSQSSRSQRTRCRWRPKNLVQKSLCAHFNLSALTKLVHLKYRVVCRKSVLQTENWKMDFRSRLPQDCFGWLS
jgi:hypothetical protein